MLSILKKFKNSESGSYTIEASVSLVFLIFAIVLISGYVRTIILENYLQSAVNNLSKETSTYSYLLVKCGIDLTSDEGNVEPVQKTVDKISVITDEIYGLKDGSGSLEGIGGAVKEFITQFKEIFSKENLTNIASETGKTAVKGLLNNICIKYYDKRVETFLPASKDRFCQYFGIIGGIDFSNSQFMPYSENSKYENSIVVVAECEVRPLIRVFGMPNMKIKKFAFNAVWSGAGGKK